MSVLEELGFEVRPVCFRGVWAICRYDFKYHTTEYEMIDPWLLIWLVRSWLGSEEVDFVGACEDLGFEVVVDGAWLDGSRVPLVSRGAWSTAVDRIDDPVWAVLTVVRRWAIPST